MPTWQEDIVEALTDLGGTGTYEQIYDALIRRRPNRTPSWKETVRRTIQTHSSDSQGFKNGDDLFFTVHGLGRGVWGLRGLVQPTPVAADLEPALDLPEGNPGPGRANQMTYRILRDTALAREIKLLHRDACQICGETLRISAEKTYSEAHHIKPLGRDHNGPDVPSNVIVLCPNHHALCDMGAIELRREAIQEVEGHEIAEASLTYHNERIFGRVF